VPTFGPRMMCTGGASSVRMRGRTGKSSRRGRA
jgi:hypothetical protein